ncbi:hypothetical protein K502DRAFT_323736 [Neoconidiobolus thromboides FSU 785]|nr:hypothetical protein K502DRAFT_323736 [Neoconidiobolus thromboides FSU 785]
MIENEELLKKFPKDWIRGVYGSATDKQIIKYQSLLKDIEERQKEYNNVDSQIKKYQCFLNGLEEISSPKRLKVINEDIIIPENFMKQDTLMNQELSRTRLLLKRLEDRLKLSQNNSDKEDQNDVSQENENSISLVNILKNFSRG